MVRKTGGIAKAAPTFKFGSLATLRALRTDKGIETFPDFQLYAMETDEEIPNILGRDFLAQYKLKVHFDPTGRSAILEY